MYLHSFLVNSLLFFMPSTFKQTSGSYVTSCSVGVQVEPQKERKRKKEKIVHAGI